MGPGAVPVSRHGFGIKRDDHTEVLGHPVEQVARHPQLVTHRDPLTRTHLKLPLVTSKVKGHIKGHRTVRNKRGSGGREALPPRHRLKTPDPCDWFIGLGNGKPFLKGSRYTCIPTEIAIIAGRISADT